MSAQEETAQPIETATPPVETPPAEKVEAPEGEQPPGQQRDANGRYKNPVQPRIDELTKKGREAERERDYWRQRAEAAEKKPEQKAEKPKVEDFENYGDYVEALADFKADEKVKANNEARDKQDAERRSSEERAKSWTEKANDAAKRITDYHDVMSASTVPVAPHVVEALRESDRGPELAYAIAKDPSVADKLNDMSPHRAAIELGRMESKLPAVSAEPDPEEESTADEPPTPVGKKPTSAPAPMKPITRGSSTPKPLEKLSMDEYVARRRSDGAKWARR